MFILKSEIGFDSAYSIPKTIKGESLSKEDIYNFIKENGTKNVTLTGGEPLIHSSIEELIYFLANDLNLLIHIETNGSVPFYKFEKIRDLNNVSFVVDYKLPSSKMEKSMDMLNFKMLKTKDVCKFVIGSIEDLERAKVILEEYKLPGKCLVYFSPIVTTIHPVEIV